MLSSFEVPEIRQHRRSVCHLFGIKRTVFNRMLEVMPSVCAKPYYGRTGVFSLKKLINVHCPVRCMYHRSLKPEIFSTPVNKPHCFNGIRMWAIAYSVQQCVDSLHSQRPTKHRASWHSGETPGSRLKVPS
jgi:hypothetical protein